MRALGASVIARLPFCVLDCHRGFLSDFPNRPRRNTDVQLNPADSVPTRASPAILCAPTLLSPRSTRCEPFSALNGTVTHLESKPTLRAGLIEMFCCGRIRENSAMKNAHFRILANPATCHLWPRVHNKRRNSQLITSPPRSFRFSSMLRLFSKCSLATCFLPRSSKISARRKWQVLIAGRASA